jgi:hypothetical protein
MTSQGKPSQRIRPRLPQILMEIIRARLMGNPTSPGTIAARLARPLIATTEGATLSAHLGRGRRYNRRAAEVPVGLLLIQAAQRNGLSVR